MIDTNAAALIKSHIGAVPDFPKPGILFRDITPILTEPRAFSCVIDLLVARYRPRALNHIVAIESRGFIFAAPVAHQLGIPLHLVRKPGKLPRATDEIAYDLEYGSNVLQLHRGDIIASGGVVIIDDLLATGGTALAAAQLVEKQGGIVEEIAFVIELLELQGRNRLQPIPTFSMVQY